MKILCIDIYNPIPINSGGDWGRYENYSRLSQKNEFTGFYTLDSSGKMGYTPSVPLDLRWMPEKVKWNRKGLQLLRLEMIVPWLVEDMGHPDVVLCTLYTYHIARTIAKRNNVPLVLITHNVEWQYWKDNGHKLLSPFIKVIETYILKKCDIITTPSARDLETFSQMVGRNKVFYVPPAPDRNIFKSEGSKHVFPKDKMNILFYGNFDKEQNVEALKMLFEEIIPQLEQSGLMNKVRINVFGSGSPPKILTDNMNKIAFHGFVENPAEFIRGADVVIAPLRNSGGVKIRIVEALSCGKRIIATREAVAGLPPNLIDNITVVEDGKGFLDAIKRLLNGADSSQEPIRYNVTGIDHSDINDVIGQIVSRTKLVSEERSAVHQ